MIQAWPSIGARVSIYGVYRATKRMMSFFCCTVTRAVRRKVPEVFLVLFFGNNDTVYKFKRSELFQIFTQTESILLKITLHLT